MSLETRLAHLFGLHGEDVWRRHANPWITLFGMAVQMGG
jgi:hypothetical protein